MRENAAVQMPRSFTKSTWMIRKTQSLVYFSKEFVEQSLLCFASVGLYRWSFFILSLEQLEQKSGSYVPLSRNSFQLVDLETQPRRWWGTKQVFLLWSLNRAHAMKAGHPRSLQHWYWAVWGICSFLRNSPYRAGVDRKPTSTLDWSQLLPAVSFHSHIWKSRKKTLALPPFSSYSCNLGNYFQFQNFPFCDYKVNKVWLPHRVRVGLTNPNQKERASQVLKQSALVMAGAGPMVKLAFLPLSDGALSLEILIF